VTERYGTRLVLDKPRQNHVLDTPPESEPRDATDVCFQVSGRHRAQIPLRTYRSGSRRPRSPTLWRLSENWKRAHCVRQQPGFTGLAIGLCSALALARGMATFIYGIPAIDPVTFFGVPAFMLAITFHRLCFSRSEGGADRSCRRTAPAVTLVCPSWWAKVTLRQAAGCAARIGLKALADSVRENSFKRA
jgi:hypothetical protein